MSDEEKEATARTVYELMLGSVVRVPLAGYYLEDGGVESLDEDTTALCRILTTNDSDVTRWCDDYLDAIWEVYIMDGPYAGKFGWAYSFTIEPGTDAHVYNYKVAEGVAQG